MGNYMGAKTGGVLRQTDIFGSNKTKAAPQTGGGFQAPAPTGGGFQSGGPSFGVPQTGGGFLVPTPTMTTSDTTGGGFQAGPDLTNTAGTNPDLRDYLDRVKKRMDGDQGAGMATTLAGQRIGEFANGQRSALGGSLARRGMLGNSGSEGSLGSEIGVNATSQFAQAAAGIASDAERRRDDMLMGSAGAFAEPGRQGLADRSLGLQQWQAQTQAQLQREGMRQNVENMSWQRQMDAARLAQENQRQVFSLYGGLF